MKTWKPCIGGVASVPVVIYPIIYKIKRNIQRLSELLMHTGEGLQEYHRKLDPAIDV